MVIAGTHDTTLVILSILVAVVAAYTALDLAGRVRMTVGGARYGWLATAALAMGGGIWSMHFVAMLAFSMPGMEVSYEAGLDRAVAPGRYRFHRRRLPHRGSGHQAPAHRPSRERPCHGAWGGRDALHGHGGHEDAGRPKL